MTKSRTRHELEYEAT